MLDSSVAIELRDRNSDIVERVDALGEDVVLSVVSRFELESGLAVDNERAAIRRERLSHLLNALRVLPLENAAADAYAAIVAACGFSRRKLADRMIAAHALSAGATLVTLNGADFADIPGLALEAWERP